MPDELGGFKTAGMSWSERARLGGLRAVIGPRSSERKNRFLHGVHRFGAKHANGMLSERSAVVDFGCGNGRFSQFFADRGHAVLGTEITPEMIDDARKQCTGCEFALTDGIAIPAEDASLDAIWACGVLRFSLFGDNPVYDKIAREMFRVLRPGGRVINLEVFVDREPDVFIPDFERAGFRTQSVKVLHRYTGRLEKYLTHRYMPEPLMSVLGEACARVRYLLDDPRRQRDGIRDYYFVFEKP